MQANIANLCENICNEVNNVIYSYLANLTMMNLYNCISTDTVSTLSDTGVDIMKSYRINRKVSISGVMHSIYANTEQEYAEKLLAYMSASSESKSNSVDKTVQTKHNFKEYALNWFDIYAAPNIATVTEATYKRQLELYLFPAFGRMNIEDITTSKIQEFFNSMCGKKATKDKVKMVLNQILEYAIDDGYIVNNPLKSKRLRITGDASKDTEPYSVEQMKYIVKHIDNIRQEYDRLFMVMITLHPLRLEEALGIRWEDIDFDNKQFQIVRAVTHPARNQPEVKETKTANSRRVLPLSEIAMRYLDSCSSRDGYIVGGENPLSYTMTKRMCDRIAKDIEFDEKITPRRFRTTVLTDICDQTKDIKLSQKMAGHTTSETTLKYYIKGRGNDTNATQAIDNLYSD